MALTKYASLEVAEILEVKGSKERITGAGLDKLSSYEDYRTDDGYLYTRVRAISSRVNKNHDGWPSEELAKSYLTFIGKPIFVDHNNSDPSRARGVIVDAKLHIENDFEKAAALDPYYSSAPENHKPPTWIELLLEVDARAFPRLAKAVIDDEIDGVSMGANVERSKCSHCANWATSPEEYCVHVLQKGASFDKYDEFGRKTASPAYEDCYDIGFFEISYVFDPADETALDLGDKRTPVFAKTAAGEADAYIPGGVEPDNHMTMEPKRVKEGYCASCDGRGFIGDGSRCPRCGGDGIDKRSTADKFLDVHFAGPMDMGGYGGAGAAGGAAPAAPGTPASTAPQNCPTCGGAMSGGVCPTCTAQAQQPQDGGPTSPNPSSQTGMMASFKIAKDGTVHYADISEYMDQPAYGDDTMKKFREETNPTDEETQALADTMGYTLQDWAHNFLATTGGNPEAAQDQMMRAFPHLSPDVVMDEIGGALARQRGVDPYPAEDMPQDPFKISKDGTVHYAQPELPQSMHMTSPEDVNTLRQEKICEVCGSDMEEGKCDVCGFETPPEGFDNPDLAKAQEIAEQAAGAAGAAMPGEAPPGAMAPPGAGAPGGGGIAPTPGPTGGPAPSGGGAPMSSTRNAAGTPTVKNAGKIRPNETPILPATKTVSDHPTTTTVTKEPTRLVQSNTKDNMTQLTKAEVVAQMVARGTQGVKTAAEAEALLKTSGLDRLLAANPASDPAEHHQNVDQVGGEVDNAEGDTQHINVEKAVDIEKIPTMTWNDGKGDSLGQESPVTSEVFEGGGPIGDTLASTKTADGQSGILGDPTNAEKQVDVNKPMMADGVVGPETKTFGSDDFHITDPVTTEDSNQVGGPIGTPLSSVQKSQIVAHTLGALKVAEQMIDMGLASEDQKYELAAQLQEESPEQLQVRTDMLAKTKQAGLGRTAAVKGSRPVLPLANSTRTASVGHDIADDNLGDSGLFR